MNFASYCSDTEDVKTTSAFLSLTLITLALSWSAPTLAQQQSQSSQFGVVYGFSVPDAENTKPFKLFGVKGAAFLSPTFSFGGYYFISDSSGQPSSTDKFSYSLHGIETAYHFGGAKGDTFTAIRIGLTKVHQTPNGDKITYSPYHYGIASGHDFHITSWMSLGFEGSYMHVQPGKTTLGSDLYERKSFNIISFLIALQFRI